MKKLLSISFALLMLLSGMNLTVATHFCGGHWAASKVSFTGKLATCGMEEEPDQCTATGVHADMNCCTNRVSHLVVDHNYSPSFLDVKYFGHQLLQVFEIPESITFHSLASINLNSSDHGPPGDSLTSAVSLSKICVFLI